MSYVYSYITDPYILGLLSIVVPFLLSLRIFPIIIYTVRAKNLMDEPGERSTHGTKTPTLGGVGLFISFAITIICLSMVLGLEQSALVQLLALLAGTMILLFLGVKDDLIALAPRKKFIGQIIAAIIVVVVADIRITGFQGLFEIGGLPYLASVLFSVLLYVIFINAYNLIDGIDGLAGAIGTVASVFFGIYFVINGDLLMLMISCILIGSLLGFLKFNLSENNKLFMGDSGSMFTGFLLTFQAIALIEYGGENSYTLPNAPILAAAILSYPALDTVRVFIIRLRNGRSPFHGDRNHIHHKLLTKGLGHKRATLLIAFTNLLIISFVYFMGELDLNLQLIVLIVLAPVLYLTPLLGSRKRTARLRLANRHVVPIKISDPSLAEANKAAKEFMTDRPHESTSNPLTEGDEKNQSEEEYNKMHQIIAKRLEEFEKTSVKSKSEFDRG